MGQKRKRILKVSVPEFLAGVLERVARMLGVRKSALVSMVIADFIEDFLGMEDRFEMIRMDLLRGVITIADHLLRELIVVKIRSGRMFCEYCKSYDCRHVKYARLQRLKSKLPRG